MADISSNINDYISYLYGEQNTEKYKEFIKKDPSQYLRINPLRVSKEDLIKSLKNNYEIEVDEVPGVDNALKVSAGENVTGKTLEHLFGSYYIQGLSSMIPPLALNPSSEDTVLDMCAAPGSKTTQLAAIMENKGTLVANEIALDRLKMLVFNVERMNLNNIGIMHYRGEWMAKVFDNYFDKILVDAPCSGLGILQKREEVNTWWSKQKAEALGDLQIKLLVAAIKMLKPGGTLIYSTCTLSIEENEAVLDKVLRKYPVELLDFEIPLKSIPAFTQHGEFTFDSSLNKAKRIIPWEADSDGFFIAKLTKTDATESLIQSEQNNERIKFLSANNKEILPHLKFIESEFGLSFEILSRYSYFFKGGDLHFVNKDWDAEPTGVFERIGAKLGLIDKNNEIVLHTQAAQEFGKYITKGIYELQDVSEVKTYLEGGIIKKQIDAHQCIVKYRDIILGTAVVTGAGIKSRLPRSRRTQGVIIK